MGRYNTLLNSAFAGCRLLANARDNCRNRDVRLFMLPGEFEHVGVSDGTDCWIAPVVADPFSVSIKRILDEIRSGKNPTPDTAPRKRVRIDLEATDPPAQSQSPRQRVRIDLHEAAEVLVEAQNSLQPRKRHVIPT